MTHDFGERSQAFSLISSVLADVGELVRKEARLAVAEMQQRAAATVGAAVCLAVGGVFAFVALMVAAAGLVFLIARTGLPLFGSCFIVAGGSLVIAVALMLVARARIGLTPRRTIAQFEKDAALVKDQAR
jgi:hypothetical protein